jgi:Alkaline phytoceramidase (aPHC).
MATPGFIGPIYCDTFIAGTVEPHMWLGMHEPVNTITNAAILIAAWLAYRHIKRSGVGFSGGLITLLVLLVGVGVGSALWHGLRTYWALQLDWIPGVLYLLVLTVLWIRQLYGWVAGVLGMLAMLLLATAGVRYFGGSLAAISPNLRFVPMFATVTLTGIIMVSGSWVKYGRQTGLLGLAIIAAGLSAAVARSIDLLVCPYIPFGTHFLWHIGLSTAACLGLVLMTKMKRAGQRAF